MSEAEMSADLTDVGAENRRLKAENERLKAENKDMASEKADMEAMMEMASSHADKVGSELLDKVDASLKEIEERVRLISETIPVPVVIAKVSDGSILYSNELSHKVFGLSADEMITCKASEFYTHRSDRQNFVNTLNQQGYISDFHARLKKKHGGVFWAAMFSRKLDFKNEPCVLTVIYDLTERRKAEEEIRRLTEELNQREEKYLMFSVAGQDFGIPLLQIREIIGMMPLTPVPNMPAYIRGVANLRGKVIPVTDLRLRFGFGSVAYSDRTGIIVTEIAVRQAHRPSLIGIIVDSVTEILSIKGKDIEPPPEYGMGINSDFISGMAKAGDRVIILLDTGHLWQNFLAT